MISANCTYDLGELYLWSRQVVALISANYTYDLVKLLLLISEKCAFNLGRLRLLSEQIEPYHRGGLYL